MSAAGLPMVRTNAGRRRGARAAGCARIAALLLLGCAGIAHGQGAGSAPSFAEACVPAEIWFREGVAIEPFTFPAATGGDAPLTYALWTPPGFSFDPATRRLTGTPDRLASREFLRHNYVTKYKATDADGDADVVSILFVVMADGYLPDRPSGTVIGDPCTEPAQMTGAFTDSTGRSIKYRLHYRKDWDLSQARGVELYFHGNSRGTEEQMLDWHGHWRPDRLSLDEGMLRAAVASPYSVNPSGNSFFNTSLGNNGTRSWYPADARAVHELLQSDFGGNAAVDRDRVLFTGDSQGPCFINYFLQRYAGVYGGGFHSNCGCLYWGSAWPPSTGTPWSPTVQWTPSVIASVAPRFRIFVQATTGDFLHNHSVAMRDLYRDVLGFETRWDLEAPGRHCAAGATPYSTIFDWLSQTRSLPRIHGTVAGDHDADGLADTVDPDDDNDGAPDVVDALPLEPREWLDTDADGIGDFLDADADGDGVPNATDPLPLDRSEWADNDADGIGDNIDADDDNDGIPDAEDAQPLRGQRIDRLNFRHVAEFGLPPLDGGIGDGRAARRHPARPSSIAYPRATGQSQSYYSVSLGDSGAAAFEIMVDSHHVRSEPCEDVLPANLCASRHEGGFGFDEWDITFESQYRLIHIDRNRNRDLTDDGAPLVLADGGPDRSGAEFAGVSTILNVPYATGARLPYRIGFVYLSAPDARERRLVYSVSSYWIGPVSVPGAEPVLVGVFDANLDGLFNSGNYRVEEAITINRGLTDGGERTVSWSVTNREKLVDLKDYACVDIDRNGELDDCGDFTPFAEEDAFAPIHSGEPFMLDGVSCTLDIPPTGHEAQLDCGADTAPDFAGAQPPGDRTYAEGDPIAALTLPEATGGDGALTYSLSPDVPGLTFTAATRRLSGTPTRAGTYSMTYTARDDDGDTDSLSFAIAVEAPDDHGDDAASATSVAAGSGTPGTPGTLDAGDVDYFAIELAAAGTLEVYTSGDTDTYGHLENAGGAEVARNDDGGDGSNFRISREVAAGTWYVRVRGYNGRVSGAYTLHARFTPTADTTPSFSGTQADLSFTEDSRISAVNLPAATGGDGTLTYSLSPSVPGLTFAADSRALGGTPTRAGTYSMTYTVRDADNDTDSLSFIITVNEADTAPRFLISQADLSHTEDSPLSAVTLPAASGGNGTLTYSLSPIVPGLGFIPTTRRLFRLSGISTRAGTYRMTYTVRDADNDTDSLNFTITVNEATDPPTDTAPRFSGSQANLSYTEDSPISARTLPAASGGNGRLTYSLSPSVPGLTFTPGTRRLSGTPTRAGTYRMTYTVRDADNDTDSLSFTITVSAAPTGNACVESNNVIEIASGASCEITQSLVDKYSLGNVSIRAGTMASCSNGRVTMGFLSGVTIQLNGLTVRCEAAPPADTSPSFSGSQAGLSLTEDSQISAVTLPAASGGNGALTYSLSPSVPGLTFTPGTRRLSGTPTRAGAYRMIYTVRDGDNDTDTLSFTITVNAADTAPSFSGSQANLSFTEDSPISAVTLPGATGGDGNLTYSLSPSVPGLTFTASNRRLSGTPTRTGTYRMTYTVRDNDNDNDSLTFTITVNEADDLLPSFSGSQANLSFTEDSSISARTLPGATGGDGALTYSLSPSVPGLTFTPGTRRLSGTPTRAGAYNMTYTVRDADNDTDSLSFTITVNEADTSPSFSGSQANLSFIDLARIRAVTLPAATSGNGNLTYSLSPSVPGLTFTASNRRLSGSPTRVGTYSMTYTATDADNDTDTQSFTITVYTAPGFSGSQAKLSFTEDSPISARTLPRATDGKGSLTYSLSPSVPGLTFTPATRRLSGTPTRAGTYSMTYTVRDVDGNFDTLTFTITVNAPDAAPSFADARFYDEVILTVNRDIDTASRLSGLTLPAASGGDGTLTYSLSPSVPGLAFAPSTRRLSGTPTRTGSYNMTYTATDEDDDTASLTFKIIVEVDTKPTFSSTQPDLTYTVGTPITAFTLPAPTGGNGHLVYTLLPMVPGLTFNPDTLRLSGTPTKAGTYSMELDALDWDLDYNRLYFTITVNEADTSPSFSGSQVNLSYTEDTAISTVTLPAASGGNGALTYSLSPSVPGLTFTASNRRLSGTPTSPGTYNMTYTVRDNDGDTDSLSFTITVESARGAEPSSPRNISVTRDGSNIRVSWDASTGATHYEVWRCDTRAKPTDCGDGLFFNRSNWSRLAGNVTATSYVDRSPPTSSTGIPFQIFYVVQACNISECSGIL